MWRLLLFGLAAIGAGLAAWSVPQIPRDRSLRQWFAPNSATAQAFADFDTAFGTDDTLLIVLRAGSPEALLDPPALQQLRALAGALEPLESVDAIVSVATIDRLNVVSTPLGPIPGLPGRYVPKNGRLTSSERTALRSDPFLRRGLLSPDGRSAATWVLLNPELKRRTDYLARVRSLVDELPSPPANSGLTQVAAGFPLLQGALRDRLWHDGLVFSIGALGWILLAAMVAGIAIRDVAAFLSGVSIAVGILSSVLLTAGHSLHSLSNAALPLLVITAGATLMHLGRARRRQGSGPPVREVARACALSTLTSAVGFAALLVSELTPLYALGAETAVGALLMFVAVAGCLWITPTSAERPATARPFERLRMRGRWSAVAITAAGIASIPWAPLLSSRASSFDVLDNLPTQDQVVRDHRIAEAAFGGLNSFEVIVALDPDRARGRLTDVAFFEQLARFQTELLQHPRLPFALSPITLLAYLNSTIEDDPAAFEVTEAAATFAIRFLVRPYLDYFAPSRDGASPSQPGPLLASFRDSMRQLLSTTGTRLRFGCRLDGASPESVRSLVHELERDLFPRWSERLGLPRGSIYATGYAVLIGEAFAEVAATQRKALVFSAAMIALVLWLVLRQFRLWILALVANALALGGLTNVAVWTGGISGPFAAVLLASILAILVDDSIHYLLRYRKLRGDGVLDAARQARVDVGPMLCLTSGVLASGFGLFALSELPVYRQFALLAAVGILLALAWDLLVLPRWLAVTERTGGHKEP